MIITKNYTISFDKYLGVYRVINLNEERCPKCGGAIHCIGLRRRKIYTREEKRVLYVRRLRCNECLSIHHELPDFVFPYKRYTLEIIKEIVNGLDHDVPCEYSTILRIRKWFRKVKSTVCEKISNYIDNDAVLELVVANQFKYKIPGS